MPFAPPTRVRVERRLSAHRASARVDRAALNHRPQNGPRARRPARTSAAGVCRGVRALPSGAPSTETPLHLSNRRSPAGGSNAQSESINCEGEGTGGATPVPTESIAIPIRSSPRTAHRARRRCQWTPPDCRLQFERQRRMKLNLPCGGIATRAQSASLELRARKKVPVQIEKVPVKFDLCAVDLP